WIGTDKEIYKIGEDKSIKIQLEIGGSANYKDVKAAVFLADYKGVIVKRIIDEEINLICPVESYGIVSEKKLENVAKGRYIFKLKIFDIKDDIIFAVDSLPFVVE
ncbi:hypothetical protein HQ584_07490, partial [Patescibacteria group bacterium]|nr:hypothetical protein [Patescibacteria group bacterium]